MREMSVSIDDERRNFIHQREIRKLNLHNNSRILFSILCAFSLVLFLKCLKIFTFPWPSATKKVRKIYEVTCIGRLWTFQAKGKPHMGAWSSPSPPCVRRVNKSYSYWSGAGFWHLLWIRRALRNGSSLVRLRQGSLIRWLNKRICARMDENSKSDKIIRFEALFICEYQ